MDTPTSNSLTIESTPKPAEMRGGMLRSWDRRFYLIITLVLIGMVAKGFWPSYFGPMVSGKGMSRPWIMHLHGAVFTGWMLLLLLQVLLVSMGRLAAHRRVGLAGIVYGVVVLGLGLVVSWAAPVMHIRAGEWTVNRAAGFMLFPLVDMVLFAGFFGAAIAYRKKPEIHKRLILAATVALAFAAVGRIGMGPPQFYLVWISPVLGGMAYDWFSRRRVHPVYLITLPIMTVAFFRMFFLESEGWLKIGRALLSPFL